MTLLCHALAKTYRTDRGDVAAVRGIDLAVPVGRFAAIIGRSGSGKSSLMAMVGGLARPSAGTVTVAGTDIWSLSEAARTRFRNQRLGFVFQSASLLPTLRALDNAALPLLLAGGARRKEAYQRACALLDEMGLGAHLDAYPTELSSGEQRRVAIARALVHDPALLLADEPTADLDEQTEREVLALLRQLQRARGTTLILVTHNLALAAEAEQVVHIVDGQVAP